MTDETTAAGEPPLATWVEPPAPAKPRPGLGEAVAWCLAFLATQIVAALGASSLVLTVYALQTPDAGKFVSDQLAGLGNATAKSAPSEGRPPVPSEIGQSLAYGMLAAQFAALLLIAVVVPRRIGRDWKRQLGVRRPAGFHVFIIALVVPGFMILSGGIQELLRAVTGIQQPAANAALNGTFRSFPWFLTFLAVALGPGLVEEVWCRGFLGRGLCARYGILFGIVLTSALFGMLHVDPSYALVTGLMGAYLHFVYLASRSIWVPILLHTLNNGIAVFATLAGVVVQLDANPQGTTPVIYLASAALVVFASVALWTSRAVVEPIPRGRDDRLARPKWQPEYPGISGPTAESGHRWSHARVSPSATVLTLAAFAILGLMLVR